MKWLPGNILNHMVSFALSRCHTVIILALQVPIFGQEILIFKYWVLVFAVTLKANSSLSLYPKHTCKQLYLVQPLHLFHVREVDLYRKVYNISHAKSNFVRHVWNCFISIRQENITQRTHYTMWANICTLYYICISTTSLLLPLKNIFYTSTNIGYSHPVNS